jgi:hypothetical protein
MTGCLTWLLLLAGIVLLVVSLIRWFEQVTDAVDQRMWGRVMTLVAIPLTVWLFPSKVAAGRPTAVPLHEPVRGFGTGTGPIMPTDAPDGARPVVSPKKKRAPVDPEAIAKLKQKMREQGMLEEKDEGRRQKDE